jgi:hypothetical protein
MGGEGGKKERKEKGGREGEREGGEGKIGSTWAPPMFGASLRLCFQLLRMHMHIVAAEFED